MGITNPAKPKEETIGGNPLPAGVDPAPDAELNQQDFDAANAFVQLLAPPRRQPLSIGALKGYYEFAKIGCAACQVPALFTGYNRVSALSYKRVYAYTDLLLRTAERRRAPATATCACRPQTAGRCSSS